MDKENVPHEKRKFMNLSSKDKPDMVDSDTISIFDLHEDMQTVDIIPIEELNKRVKREGDELIEMQPDELQEGWVYLHNINEEQLTVSGTNISDVKRKNAQAGLSYNEVKEVLAKNGGFGTAKYSDTDSEEVKAEINQSMRKQ